MKFGISKNDTLFEKWPSFAQKMQSVVGRLKDSNSKTLAKKLTSKHISNGNDY